MSAARRNVLASDPVFRRLWIARAVSFIGDGVALTALVLHVESSQGTGTAVGALLLAQAIPHLAGPIAGTIADRIDQRRLMIACDLGRCLLFAISALFLPSLVWLLLLMAAASSLDTLFAPAGRSAVPALVHRDDLLNANAWLGTALNMQVALGPLLGASWWQRWVCVGRWPSTRRASCCRRCSLWVCRRCPRWSHEARRDSSMSSVTG